jgi:signal transduction histidine kinase
MRELTPSRSRLVQTLASVALLAALVAAMLPGHRAAVAVPFAAIGVIGGAALTARGAVQMLWRYRTLFGLLLLAGFVIAWIVVGVTDANRGWQSLQPIKNGSPFPALGLYDFLPQTSWPWRVGRLPLWPLVFAVISAAGGFVLIADAVRVQIGLARPPRSVWRSITATPTRGGRIAIRAVPGVALIGVAAFLAVGLVNRYAAYHPITEMVVVIAIVAIAALLIASPVAVGVIIRLDFDKEHRARERERQRFAAHLHDSVLQTLALIQRQAADPETVVKLARRQEHALRAWMAGEADLGSATVAVAVRDMVTELEDEHGMKIELTAIGDAKLDGRNEEMVAAAREALRNVARHAPGAPVNVFLDVGEAGTELFIRDSGPGFEFDEVPAERRGLRDAVIGRMRFAGGSATVESHPGEGTEVALALPHLSGRGR